MVGVMGAPRSRTPNEGGARDIAGALYPDLGSVEWIPSDDADVFRLSFTSGREPRILKMATHGIRPSCLRSSRVRGACQLDGDAGCRRPKTKYEIGTTPAELTTATTGAHNHFGPRIWFAGRRLMSMRAAPFE